MEPNEIARMLAAPLTDGRTLKTNAFQHAVEQQGSLVHALQLEQRRIAALHGSESRNAQTVQSLVTAHRESLARANENLAQAQIRPPAPNPQEFIIYGYVKNQEGAPEPDIDVSAADDKGTILQTTTSDADGSYALHIDPHTTKGCLPMDEATRQQTPQTFHLVASDKKKTFLIQSQTTFQFELGKLAYEDLSVPIGGDYTRAT